MIVVFGSHDDPPINMVLDALQERGVPFAFLDSGALHCDGLRITCDRTALTGHLDVAGQKIPLEAIRSIYTRPLQPVTTAENPHSKLDAQAAYAQLVAWLDVAPGLVINRPCAMRSNNSKPLQAQMIGRSGFLVPETLITSRAEEARQFWQTHDRVVFKSISGVRSIVRELDDNQVSRLGLLTHLPVQFQAYVPGIDVRAHVVGRQCFAAEIESNAIDYRYVRGSERTELRCHALPPEVKDKCIRLAAQMDLPLAGIDLRRRPDGQYVCFEVNPMPAFSFYESHTQLPISGAVADLLIAA